MKWLTKKQNVEVFNEFSCLRIVSCEHGSEPSGSIKGGGFLSEMNDCQIPKKNFAPFSHSVNIPLRTDAKLKRR
jgi:hypothetical protein